MLPYRRHSVDEADIEVVVSMLRSDHRTTGPKVEEFETALATYLGCRHAVAVSSSAAALHAALHAIDLGPGDEVIVPTMTFAATANAIVYLGATPVFADVAADTLLLEASEVNRLITPRTRAVIGVDYAGQPCDYRQLEEVCRRHHLCLIADASHSLGAAAEDRPVGRLADMTVFSLHAVQPSVAGEGGVVTTENPEWDRRMRRFRHHGIEQESPCGERDGAWCYQMVELGYHYRLTDIQGALALNQLRRVDESTRRRQQLADHYRDRLRELPMMRPLRVRGGCRHAHQLFVVEIEGTGRLCRQYFLDQLRARNVATRIDYVPVHLHPFYRRRFGTSAGQCPIAERAYSRILSLPLCEAMELSDVDRVVDALREIVRDVIDQAA